MNIAVVGSVDAAKSTLIATLTKNILDDGNGKAREEVAKHDHEIQTGRTSDIGWLILEGDIPQSNSEKTNKEEINKEEIKIETKTETKTEIKKERKYVHLLDLAGHEAYLKTTLRGITNYSPHYAILVISLNRGITPITKEHLAVCRNLKLPIIVVLSKVDICPKNILEETVNSVRELCKKYLLKFFYTIKDDTSYEKAMNGFNLDPFSFCPIFFVSNKTGEGLEILRKFLLSLPKITNEHPIQTMASKENINSLFIIYRRYRIKGIGIVVHGKVQVGTIRRNDTLSIGPFKGQYFIVRVSSLHNEIRENVNCLEESQTGCLALKFDKKEKSGFDQISFTHGKCLISKPILVNQVKADIYICSPRVTINVNYHPYIHCGNAEMDGYFVQTEKENLRYQNTATVIIHFGEPIFTYPMCKMIIRDGTVIAIGIVREVYSDPIIPFSKKRQ